jgi:uncharacterized protein
MPLLNYVYKPVVIWEIPRMPKLNLPDLPPGRHYRFHAMIKPSGAECNIDCEYCFYLHKSELLAQSTRARMDDVTLERHIKQYIEGQTGEEVVFSWQGGEPTLMGLAFFEKAVALQEKYAKPNQRISNDLQTNGIALDAEWCSFLKTHGFHVGLSIDGPRELHDIYRKTRNGKPTFDYVVAAAKMLHEAEIPFAALCVVNRINAKHPLETYRFLADEIGTWRIQFTPAVEPTLFKQTAPALSASNSAPRQNTARARPGHPLSVVTDWSVDPDDYGDFLITIWDEWIAKDLGRIHVNLFETAVAQAAGMPAQTCTQSEFCGKALAVEHNGDVYSCDHFVYPEFKIGNIAIQHLGDLAFSNKQQDFGAAKSSTLPKQCRECDYLKLCWGECPKNRLILTQDGKPGLNYLCSGLYKFYDHIGPDVVRLLQGMGVLRYRG